MIFLRFLFVLTFSFLTSYAAAKDERAAKTALRPIKMDHAPPSEREFKVLFGPRKWGRGIEEWENSGQWFNALGYFYRRDIVPKRNALEKRSKALYRRLMAGEEVEAKIPAHLHRVWVTSNKAPYEAPEARIADYIHTMNELGEGFSSTFWCLDKTKIPKTVDVLEAHPRIQVREVKELWAEDIRGQAVFQRLLAGNYFALCSDIVRYKVVHLFGGFYGDLGMQLKKDITPLRAYDFIGVQKGFRFSNGFFGAEPKFHGLDRLLTFIDILDFSTPPALQAAFTKTGTPIWIGTWAFTLNTELGLGPDDTVLYLQRDNDPYFRYHSMASWVKTGAHNFGQATVRSPRHNPLNLFFFPNSPPYFQVPVIRNWGDGKEQGFGGTSSFSEKLFGTGKAHLLRQKRASLAQARKIFQGPLSPPLNRIPHTSHQMWITKEKQIPQTHIAATIQRCRSLGEGWTHILWVMDEEVLAPSITKLKEGLPGLEVRQVYDVFLRKEEDPAEHSHKVKMGGQPIVAGLFEGGAFVSVTDVLRKSILFSEGGFYADMGIQFNMNITPLLDRADAVFYANPSTNLFDTGVMMAAKGDPVLERYFGVLDRIHEHVFFPRDRRAQLWITGLGLYQSCFLQDAADKVVLPLVLGKVLSNTCLGTRDKKVEGMGNETLEFVIRSKSIYAMSQE